MLQDPTIFETENQAPGLGAYGKMGVEKISPRGTSFQNPLGSHQPVLDTSPVVLRDAFDVTRETEDLSYLEPASLARKILGKTQYDPKYCEEMVSFFLAREKNREIREDYVWRRTGEVSERYRTVANPPPMFSEFGRKIGVSEKTLKSWAKKYNEFAEAYEVCQDIIQEFMVENGLSGDYSSQFGIFVAKNITKMKDVQVNKNENYNMKEILDSIEKGQYEQFN